MSGVTVCNLKSGWVFYVKAHEICSVKCARGCFGGFLNIIVGLGI